MEKSKKKRACCAGFLAKLFPKKQQPPDQEFLKIIRPDAVFQTPRWPVSMNNLYIKDNLQENQNSNINPGRTTIVQNDVSPPPVYDSFRDRGSTSFHVSERMYASESADESMGSLVFHDKAEAVDSFNDENETDDHNVITNQLFSEHVVEEPIANSNGEIGSKMNRRNILDELSRDEAINSPREDPLYKVVRGIDFKALNTNL